MRFFPRKESWPASVWASSSITRCVVLWVCLMRNSGKGFNFQWAWVKKHGSPCHKSPKPFGVPESECEGIGGVGFKSPTQSYQ